MTDKNDFKIICMNVRSLRKHHQDVAKDVAMLKADVIIFVKRRLRYQTMAMTWILTIIIRYFQIMDVAKV